MKTTLAELTAAEFIDLICGNTSVLLGKHELANPANLASAMRNIIVEYKTIADPVSMHGYFGRIESLIKAKIGLVIFSMCNNLITFKQYDHVKEVLTDYGLNVSTMSDKRLEIEVRSRVARLKQEQEILEAERADAEDPKTEEIRTAFDKQTAAMMAHFKFQIDGRSMQATIYAHLVERFTSEIKAQREAMKKK